jgi:hypothetical protein
MTKAFEFIFYTENKIRTITPLENTEYYIKHLHFDYMDQLIDFIRVVVDYYNARDFTVRAFVQEGTIIFTFTFK